MIAALVTAGLVAGCVGSFACTASIRWLRGEQAIVGASRCDACAKPLSFVQSIPLISYLVLKGRCAACRARIDPAHPIAEGLCIAVSVLAFGVVGGLPALLISLLGLALICLAVIDWRAQRLPDLLVAVVLALALGLVTLRGMDALVQGLASGAVLVGVLIAVRLGFQHLVARTGLGLGDVKLAGALSVWVGLLSPWALAAGAALGLVWIAIRRPADGRIAFGPFLALAYFVIGFGQEAGLWPTLI